ncbi:MAG: DUF6051 family protein [Bacteroidales bacterium]
MKLHKFTFEEVLGRGEIISDMKKLITPSFFKKSDDNIAENLSFEYPIVEPENSRILIQGKHTSVILLFHGLNERSWDKYYSWAEFIANNTGKPVLLFPIAFHINRSPKEWSNPRAMQPYVVNELAHAPKPFHLTFLNFALSVRIKADPYRFYLAGRETVNNVCQLIGQIKKGDHPFIDKTASIDIFAYSIGALLSQVMLFANPNNYFTNSRLFMFCGGSLFNQMNGDSKMIMDRDSFGTLLDYYKNRFIFYKHESRLKGDLLELAFVSHIDYSLNREYRESFYEEYSPRIRAISLKKDKVIPTNGIKSALGIEHYNCLEELDFPFEYSHEIPFPADGPKVEPKERIYWFEKVFSKASDFLS